MTKNYQTKTTRAAMSAEVVIPDRVSVAMADLAGAMREGLLGLAVGAGLQVMQALMDESVDGVGRAEGSPRPNAVLPT
jgi:putative transposase